MLQDPRVPEARSRASSPRDPVSLNCRLRVSGHRPLRGQAWAIFFLSSIKPQESRVRLRPSAPRIWNTCPLATGPWPGDPALGESSVARHGWRAGWGHIFLPGHALGSATPVRFEEIKRKGKTSLPHATLSPPWPAAFGWLYFFIVFLHFVFPPARPFTVCRSRFSHSPFTRLRPRRCACLIPRPLAVETAHRLNDPVAPAPGASVASEEAPRRPAWRRQARAEQIGKGS